MTTYYVDDGGNNTDGTSWANAYYTLKDLDVAVAPGGLSSGDVVYVGHDSVDTYTHSGPFTFSGPATGGAPCVIKSVTQGSTPVTYQVATANQIDTDSYSLTTSGHLSFYGIQIKTAATINLGSNADSMYFTETTFAPGANGSVSVGASAQPGKRVEFYNCTIDHTADSSSTTNASMTNIAAQIEIRNLTITNAGDRYGSIFSSGDEGNWDVIGVDASSWNDLDGVINLTAEELNDANISNVQTGSTWTPFQSVTPTGRGQHITLTNIGPDSDLQYIADQSTFGSAVSTDAIYRTNGATVQGTSTAWLITTTSSVCECYPYRTPFLYGVVETTGSHTFDVYITNDTADLKDNEAWLEIAYGGTAGEASVAYATDQRITTTTAANQTDDTSSAWNGTGPSFTYKQKLSVTVTVNRTGVYTARVSIAKASVASSSYLYVDPLVTIT